MSAANRGAASSLGRRVLLGAIVGLVPTISFAQYQDPAVSPAEIQPLAARSLILGFAESNARGIAVGERGHVLVSETRRDWRQVAAPTRATLNAVTAVGDQVWAVGHDGVILHSADGGLTWSRQHHYPGCVLGSDGENDAAEECPGPLLDVLFIDAQRGFAVGAYGTILRTEDGGSTWQSRPMDLISTDEEQAATGDADALEGEEEDSWLLDEDDFDVMGQEVDVHLNGIIRTPSGALFVAAESGRGFRSLDDGESWETVTLPYAGSMFGTLALGDQHVIVYGLRGNIFETLDLGDTWAVVATGLEVGLMGGRAMPGGGFVVVGANGNIVVRRNAESPAQTFVHPDGESLAATLILSGNELVVGGVNGISLYQPR